MTTPQLYIEALAIWGAIISTLLAGIKFWEVWNTRFQIDVGYNFTTSEDIGNQIFIRNLMARPIVLTSWDLCYANGVWPFRKVERFFSPDFDSGDFKVEPYSTLTLSFRGENYFSTSPKVLKGRSICVRAAVAGRGRFQRTVFRADD